MIEWGQHQKNNEKLIDTKPEQKKYFLNFSLFEYQLVTSQT